MVVPEQRLAAESLLEGLQLYAPLGVALVLVGLLIGAALSPRLSVVATRFALIVFEGAIDRHRSERTHRLQAARYATPYRVYATRTLLFAVGGGIAIGMISAYTGWWALRVLAVELSALPESVTSPTAPVAFAMLLASAIGIGLLAGGIIYWLRWWYPGSLAESREKRIDATMPQIVAFVYALARSGMAFPEVMRITAAHSDIYGAAAEEFEVGVRHMDIFGRDIVTALREMSDRSASDTFGEFAENLASVLQSGRDLESFLETQHQEFREEAEAQQRQLLTLLSTLAEAYVTLFVAGPLFLITILIIFGLTGAQTLTPLRLFVYLVLPAGNVIFMAYLDTALGSFGGIGRGTPEADKTAPEPVAGGVNGIPKADQGQTDGGHPVRSEVTRQLALYDRLSRIQTRLRDPLGTLRQSPELILYVSVPIVVAITAVRALLGGPLTLGRAEGLLVQFAVVVVSSFAIAYEYHRRRIERIEAVVPDFLDRLASVNQAGVAVIRSIDRVRESDLGALNPEIDRLWAELQWGASIETGLKRLEARVQTVTMSRVVALITNAMSASGQIARVLAIAAAQAKADRTLKRERRQEMLVYTIVIYVSFAVFLAIIVALDTVLLPNLPEAGIGGGGTPAGVPTGGLSGFGDVDVAAYQTVFRHTAYIQALVTGLIAGQMSRGDIRAGAVHATVLLVIAAVTFAVI